MELGKTDKGTDTLVLNRVKVRNNNPVFVHSQLCKFE